MTFSDAINGSFELAGACALGLNTWRLWKDKQLKGVHWASTVFFTTWGIWNLYYYPHLDQWLSFAGGICIVTVNTVWLSLLVFFSRRQMG